MAGTIIHGMGLEEALRADIREALAKREVEASELAEFYLVTLLADFHAKGKLADVDIDVGGKPLALLLMEAATDDRRSSIATFRRVGDTALIVASFFAERIRRTLMDISYYISIGTTAYQGASTLIVRDPTTANLYAELAEKFETLSDALSLVAPWNRFVSSNVEVVRLWERWLASGDTCLGELLEKCGIDTKE